VLLDFGAESEFEDLVAVRQSGTTKGRRFNMDYIDMCALSRRHRGSHYTCSVLEKNSGEGSYISFEDSAVGGDHEVYVSNRSELRPYHPTSGEAQCGDWHEV